MRDLANAERRKMCLEVPRGGLVGPTEDLDLRVQEFEDLLTHTTCCRDDNGVVWDDAFWRAPWLRRTETHQKSKSPKRAILARGIGIATPIVTTYEDSGERLSGWFCVRPTLTREINWNRFGDFPKRKLKIVKRHFTTWFMQLDLAITLSNGKHLADVMLLGQRDGDWDLLGSKGDGTFTIDGWKENRLQSSDILKGPVDPNAILTSMCDVVRHWSVDFSLDDSIGSARVLTDSIGAREAFKLRDIPNGKTRRAALRHWVKQHWRQSRVDPSAASFVSAHLRGAETFHWNGLNCKITPALEEVRYVASHGLLPP